MFSYYFLRTFFAITYISICLYSFYIYISSVIQVHGGWFFILLTVFTFTAGFFSSLGFFVTTKPRINNEHKSTPTTHA